MTSPVTAMGATADVADLIKVMGDGKIRSMAIVDGSRVVGIVTRRDLVRIVGRADRTARGAGDRRGGARCGRRPRHSGSSLRIDRGKGVAEMASEAARRGPARGARLDLDRLKAEATYRG